MGSLFGLVVSAGYICLSCLIAWWARKLTEKLCPKPSLSKALLLEGIATWELCAACFELIIVADNYGVAIYALFLFSLTVWWSGVWEEATACPYMQLEELVGSEDSPGGSGGPSILAAISKILAQLAGGALTHRYAMFLWSLEVSSTHRGRAFEACTADLQVAAPLGGLIEAVCTCLCRLVSRALVDSALPHASLLDAFFGTSLVVLAFNYSGGYFNPALATALKFGCRGHSTGEFLAVYWLGSSLGAIASLFIYRSPTLQNLTKKLSPSKTD